MKATISELRKIDIEDIIEKLGGVLVGKGSGGSLRYTSPFRDETKGSFYAYPDNNKWHDFGHVGRKSGDGLDLVCEFLKEQGKPYSPKEGLEYAGDMFNGLSVSAEPRKPRVQTVKESNSIVIDSVRDQLSPSTLNYVKDRGITSMGAIRENLKQVHFHFEKTPDKKWYAAGFASDKKGFEVRGEIKGEENSFNLKYAIGNKSPTTVKGAEPSDTLSMFEGFFDYLTHLQREGTSVPKNDTIILNSNNMIDEAIKDIEGKGYKSLDLYKQNDKPGQKVLTALQDAFPGRTINDKSSIYKGFSDYNEFHQSTLKASIGKVKIA